MQPLLSRVAILIVLGGLAWSTVALATSLVVPDESPTIQGAIDSGVDTVLVRGGVYSETVIVWRQVAIVGLTTEAAVVAALAGLRIWPAPSVGLPLIHFSDLQITGRVVTICDFGACDIRFVRCSLMSGVTDSSRYMDTNDFILSKCTLVGRADLWAKGRVVVDSCEVNGIIAGHGPDYELVVRGSTVLGGGIYSSSHGRCTVEGNTIRGGVYGVSLHADNTAVVGNIIEDCQSWGINVGRSGVTVANNTVIRCGGGIAGQSSSELFVTGNQVVDARGTGIFLRDDPYVSENIVLRSSGNGIRIDGPYVGGVVVRRNTSCLNGGSGFVSTSFEQQTVDEWIGNVAYGNGEYGVHWATAPKATIACNDWFGNQAGNVEGRAPSSADYSMDPLFCDLTNGDVRLSARSPLLNAAGCGQIGALGVGCGFKLPARPMPRPSPRSGLSGISAEPWGGLTRIAFALDQAGSIEIEIFDVLGRKIAVAAQGQWVAGTHLVEWNGLGRDGRSVRPGVYLVRFAYPGGRDERRFARIQ